VSDVNSAISLVHFFACDIRGPLSSKILIHNRTSDTYTSLAATPDLPPPESGNLGVRFREEREERGYRSCCSLESSGKFQWAIPKNELRVLTNLHKSQILSHISIRTPTTIFCRNRVSAFDHGDFRCTKTATSS
jgi:hypothetical protein